MLLWILDMDNAGITIPTIISPLVEPFNWFMNAKIGSIYRILRRKANVRGCFM